MKVVSLLGLVHKVRTCGRPEARTRSPKRIVLPMEQYAPGRPARKSGDQPCQTVLVGDPPAFPATAQWTQLPSDRNRKAQQPRLTEGMHQPSCIEAAQWPTIAGVERTLPIANRRYSRLKICATGVGSPET